MVLEVEDSAKVVSPKDVEPVSKWWIDKRLRALGVDGEVCIGVEVCLVGGECVRSINEGEV